VTLEIFLVALGALRANKLRSLLTMLGIVIGVAAVITVVALGSGAQQAVADRLAKLGTTTLQIDATRIVQGGVQLQVAKKITMPDVNAIESRGLHLIAVEPQQDQNRQVVWRNRNTNITIIGATANFLFVRKFDIDLGRMYTAAEDEGRQRVAVLGAGALTQLGVDNPNDIIGDNIRIAGMQFTVIGTLVAKGTSAGFGSPDDQILIPFNTGRFRVFGTDKIDDIFATATTEEDIPLAMEEITLALRRTHRIAQGAQDDFRIRNQSDVLTVLSDTTQVFTLLLAGIAAVSLLVGGIGIMNIMLVSVTERTREIGVRKALGATRRNILAQFLMEAVTLCLAGGALGVATGVSASVVMRQIGGWTTLVEPPAIVVAFAFAALIGVVFGVWPARRAARLDPIEALRYE
jgi:putative ABC transport system permease protein